MPAAETSTPRLDEQASAHGARPGPGPRSARRWITAGTTALLVLGLVVGWYLLAGHRADQVAVSWTGDPECTGADVVSHTEELPSVGEEPWSGPLIRAERGMRCIITVEVHNASGGTVHLDHAVLPYMGPRGGAVLKADTTGDPESWSTPRGSRVDSVLRLDVTLRAGETSTFEIPLVFREGGCSGGRNRVVRMWVDGFPVVTIGALGRTVDRPAHAQLSHTQVGPSRGCAQARG